MDKKLFQQAIQRSQDNFYLVNNLVCEGQLGNSSIRFNVWQIWLALFQAGDTKEIKINKIEQLRAQIQGKLKQLPKTKRKLKKPSKDKSLLGPLFMLHGIEEQPSTLCQKNQQTIKKDIDRTFSNSQFFNSQPNKAKLFDMLMCYCNLHNIAYQQGMNDLAAIVLICHHNDIKQHVQYSQKSRLTFFLRDPENIQKDSFPIYQKIMQPLYELFKDRAKGYPQTIFNVIKKISRVDPKLGRAISMGQINAEIIILKWLRCLFVRDFGWDKAFAMIDFWLLQEYTNRGRQLTLIGLEDICAAAFVETASNVNYEHQNEEFLMQVNKGAQNINLKRVLKKAELSKTQPQPTIKKDRKKWQTKHEDDENQRKEPLMFDRSFLKRQERMQLEQKQMPSLLQEETPLIEVKDRPIDDIEKKVEEIKNEQYEKESMHIRDSVLQLEEASSILSKYLIMNKKKDIDTKPLLEVQTLLDRVIKGYIQL